MSSTEPRRHRSGLPESELRAIAECFPDSVNLYREIVEIAPHPAWIEWFYLPNGTGKGIAWTCLTDAAEMLMESRYALFEATAYARKYDVTPPDETTERFSALGIAQYYLDDTVLRLYATAESIAASLRSFHGEVLTWPSEMEHAPASDVLKLSRAIQVAKLTDPASAQVVKINANPAARWVADYRGSWTHNQRKRMQGTGLRFGRIGPRADRQVTPDGRTIVSMSFGGGDEPEVTITEALTAVTTVHEELHRLITACMVMMEHDIPVRGAGWERRGRDKNV